ncbi:MAG: hypothetical protein KAH25_05195 [Bacteroidales bacterium]|nr:hypothetical protein [Bacteroidales bacterium]
MKHIIRNIVIIAFLVFSVSVSHQAIAQTAPPPNGGDSGSGGGGVVGGGAPISGGLGILMVLGAVYGGRKIYQKKSIDQ